MRIHSISKVLALPFVILFVILLYLTIDDTQNTISYWMIVPVIALTILFVMNGQIDYWYLKRNPPELDPPIKIWLEKYSSHYKSLTSESKKRFEERLALYIFARSFTSIGEERREVPEDIKGIIGHIPVLMSLQDEDFLIGDYDHIYLYKHPFPSPKMRFLHTVETEHEDGVIIFSLEHLIPPLINKESMYNIGFHAFANAYVMVNMTKPWPDMFGVNWDGIQRIAGFSKDQIIKTLGYEPKDFLVILINYYFNFNRQLFREYPEVHLKLKMIFAAEKL